MKLFFIFYLLSPHLQHKSEPQSPGESCQAGGRKYLHFILLFYFILFYLLFIHVFMPHLFQRDSMDKWLSEWKSGTQDRQVQVTLSRCPIHAASFQTLWPRVTRYCVCELPGTALLDPSCHHWNSSFGSPTGLRAVISLNRQTPLCEASKVELLCLRLILFTVGVGLSFCL